MLNKKISQPINPKAVEICHILNQAGFQAFLVGGCIRDLLLNKQPKDYDITTDANPATVIKLFEKTIPTGLQHGTVTVVMGEGVENHFEVTTFRIEGEYSDGRHPNEVFFVMDVEKDLARRDLTINSIAYDPISDNLVDPFNGIEDLIDGTIRAVGSPQLRFQEDGLRIMRVARFASRFGYQVDELTFQGMKENLSTLKKVSKERINDELCKTLMTDNPSLGLKMLFDSGILGVTCPLLTEHSLEHIINQDKCLGELETRIAFLYSNLPSGKIEKELIALKFSNKEIKKTVFLSQLLERFALFQNKNTINAYKSFMAVVKNCSPEPWEQTLQQFIMLATTLQLPIREMLEQYKDEIVLSRKEMQINGDDLINSGIPVGPRIKTALEACYLEILRNPENNNRYYLLEYSRQY